MITVFGRNYAPIGPVCDPNNLYAATFDGIQDFLQIYPAGSVLPTTDYIWSFWVKRTDTNANDTALRWFWGQSVPINNGPNFIRMIMNSVATNTLEFEFRSNTAAHSIKRQWVLHDAANQAITGSTSSASRWVLGNSAINVNTNGYVHLLFHYKGATYGSPSGATDCDLYWNGQLMTQGGSPVTSGVVTNPGVFSYRLAVGTNPFNLSTTNMQAMYMDSFLLVPGGFSGGQFQLAEGLTGYTDQQLVDFIYNSGCPGVLSGSTRYGRYDFEQNYDSTPFGNYTSWTSAHTPPFTTNHA
jgi:hypothetical protein